MHRLCDVLDHLATEVFKGRLKLAFDLIVDATGKVNAARLRQGLEPCRDVDPVTIEIAALDHHVAEIDPDSQPDSPIRGQICIGAFHTVLQLDGTFDGVDSTG